MTSQYHYLLPTNMSQIPDYYKILQVPKAATYEAVRQAYKKESLKTHPDRLVNVSPTERRRATERFQAVADAYYVLSDTKRRGEYDALYESRSDKTTDPNASSSFFTNMFGSTNGNTTGAQPNPDHVFTDVFDELLRPEVDRHAHWWSWIGAICGAGLGFIIANLPGLMVGAVAGNRLGAVRDAKGKAVAAVFNDLGGQQKAEVLRALASKVLGSAL